MILMMVEVEKVTEMKMKRGEREVVVWEVILTNMEKILPGKEVMEVTPQVEREVLMMTMILQGRKADQEMVAEKEAVKVVMITMEEMEVELMALTKIKANMAMIPAEKEASMGIKILMILMLMLTHWIKVAEEIPITAAERAVVL